MGFVEVKPKEWYIEQAKITKVWSKKLEENETYMHGAEDFEPVCPYINPQFRFKTKFFKVVWMVLEEQALNTLGSHAEKVRSCYVLDKYCALFVKATSESSKYIILRILVLKIESCNSGYLHNLRTLWRLLLKKYCLVDSFIWKTKSNYLLRH